MALDQVLLQAAAREEAPPTLRFYGWSPPAVSVGRFQTLEGIAVEEVHRRGWELVRRPTGGRAVLHHREVTYSLVLPSSAVGGAGIRTSYDVLVAALNEGLRTLLEGTPHALGAPPPACDARANRAVNCFALAGECDTLVADGKLVGSAQARLDGALLQHGSVLLDADPEVWTAVFGEPGRLAALRRLLGTDPDPARVRQAILTGFTKLGVTLSPGELTAAELEAADSLARQFVL
jgi:lipoate-protein ligase A